MALSSRWLGRDQGELISRVRMHCYGQAERELPVFVERLKVDHRGRDGDYLIVERDGVAVGTATSLSFPMHCRGGTVPCQGVAWVGTVKTERRKGAGQTRGVASIVMAELLNKARERGEVVSALMPFRASFYEHFGYGVVERRCQWTVPLGLLPQGDTAGLRFFQNDDLDAITACRTREARAGQCDIDAGPAGIATWRPKFEDGFVIVDRPDRNGPVRAWMQVVDHREAGKAYAKVTHWSAEIFDAFVRLLSMLGTWKDQYTAAIFMAPADWPVNWLLKERQVPHRLVDHPVAKVEPHTRMQIRVLDHKRFVESLRLPPDVRGSATVAIRETEGTTSTLSFDVEDGRALTRLHAGDPQVELTDVTWAAVVSGELPIETARSLGVAQVRDDRAAKVLECFARGRAPWCNEYF
jgi:hypothetical protein